jgi:hypothetical protein
METARVRSVNVGSREVNPAKDVGVTGIGKRPVGALLRAPGTIRRDDPVRLVAEEAHDVLLPETFRGFMGDPDAARRVLDADFLPEDESEWLRGRVAARR